MIATLLMVLMVSSSALAVDKAVCAKKARAFAEQVKVTNWSSHNLAAKETIFSQSEIKYRDQKSWQFDIEWVDHTVGGDASISMVFDESECSLLSLETYNL